MKNIVTIVIGVVVLLVGIRWYMQQSAAKEAFEKDTRKHFGKVIMKWEE